MQVVVIGFAAMLIVLLAAASLLLLRQAHRVFDMLRPDEGAAAGAPAQSVAQESQGARLP